MSHYIVGSDKSGNGDTECINKICEVLESAGHTAENIGVTPNLETDLKKGKGNIGVFIVNGVCIGTFDSVCKMVKAGGCDYVFFGMPKSIGTSSKYFSMDAIQNKKVPIAHDDNFTPEPRRSELDGKYTIQEYCDENKEYVYYAYGDTCEEVGEAILNGGSGNGDNSDNASQKEKQVMSGWESCCDLLKGWDGEASMVQRGDCVIVKTIEVPTDTVLKAYEGINVVDDSVTISDYTPEIYNTFSIKWGENGENELEFSFTKHKELFGERKTEVQATKRIPKNSEEAQQYRASQQEEKEEESSENDDGGFFGLFGGRDSSTDVNNIDYSNISDSDNFTGESESQYEEVPITTLEEAIRFGYKTVGKAMRKDGHQIDLKVIGNNEFKVGNWCHVFLPKFFIDGCYYIIKSNSESSADKEYIISLTLVDYPPSLGSGDSNSPSGSNEEESEESDESQEDNMDNENEDSSNNDNSTQDSEYPEAN